jgi:iron(III) transport system permease protein
VLVAAPLAVPAPLVGVGLIALFNRDLFGGFSRGRGILVLAMLARFAPIAALVILAQLRRIDREILDAARLFRRSRAAGWLRVELPLAAPGLLAAACIVFAFSAGELGATQMTGAAGYQTLTGKIYNYMHHGSSSAVASLCLLMTVTTLAAGTLAVAAWHVSARWLGLGRTRP